MSFVEIDNLHISYGKTEAVRGITFEIPEGEVFGFSLRLRKSKVHPKFHAYKPLINPRKSARKLSDCQLAVRIPQRTFWTEAA